MNQLFTALSLTFAISLPLAQAQNVPVAINTCLACHGQNGVSVNDIWPNLAGQKKEYLIKQIKAFRAETRKDPTMNPLVKNLEDEDITKIATYFSGLK